MHHRAGRSRISPSRTAISPSTILLFRKARRPAPIVEALNRILVISPCSISSWRRSLPNFWFTADGSSFVTVETDEIGVTCRLLARLKQKADAADVRLLVYLQYGGLEVVDSNRMAAALGSGMYYRAKRWIKTKLSPLLLNIAARRAELVRSRAETGTCARGLGIKTIDELPVLRAVYRRNPSRLAQVLSDRTRRRDGPQVFLRQHGSREARGRGHRRTSASRRSEIEINEFRGAAVADRHGQRPQ